MKKESRQVTLARFSDERWPEICKGNPGRGTTVKVGFARGDQNWSEEADLIELTARVLEARGFSMMKRNGWLEDSQSGMIVLPQMMGGVHPTDRGGVRTTTTVQVHHAEIFPQGVFEYQHSWGSNTADSIRKGLDQWAATDWAALMDAVRTKPRECTSLRFSYPAKEGGPALFRQAVLGPVSHFREKTAAQNEKKEEHSFCPCCLLTRSLKAFEGLLQRDAFFGLRLFASRDGEGKEQADCRVNGEDWPQGAEALREYVKTWDEDCGFEFRKQYVVLQTVAPSERVLDGKLEE